MDHRNDCFENTSIGIIASEYIMFTESFTLKEYLFTNAILEKIYSNLQKKNTLNE